MDLAARINRHYASHDLANAILAGVAACGQDPDRFHFDVLSPVDQFHTRGLEATRALARLAALEPGQSVLDIGGGIGGAARTLAAEHDCRITVLELTEEYCRVGRLLTERSGLRERVVFAHGNALALPFGDRTFDVVWTQHCSMNIEDKPGLYREAFRVLRPGGRLAQHEIAAGPREPIHFPVPWAAEPALSFLSRPSEIKAHAERSGFHLRVYRESSAAALEWFRARLAFNPTLLPPLGLHLVFGERMRAALENVACNLAEGRIVVTEAIYARL